MYAQGLCNVAVRRVVKHVLFISLIFLCGASSLIASDNPTKLITLLKQGGYVIYWRHAKTDHKQVDSEQLDLDDCSTQRNLDPEGKEQARYVGLLFKKENIPVGQILTSPFCRCRETAELAFANDYEITVDKTLYFAIGTKKKQRTWQSLKLVEQLSTRPEKGNTILVSHTANLKEAVEIWPKPEGAMYVFSPHGTQYEFVGRLTPDFFSKSFHAL